jgi:TPR repeat protein
MTTIKDTSQDPLGRQKRLPAPDRLPLAPAYSDDQAPIAALLQSIANEISQSDQRQGTALADLRARLNLLSERQPSAEPVAPAPEPEAREHVVRAPAGAAKPVLAIEDRRVEAAAPAPAVPKALAAKPAPAQLPPPEPAPVAAPKPAPSLDMIYASVAQSYTEAARKPRTPVAARALLPQRLLQVEPVAAADEDSDFLDMSALVDAYAPKPARAPSRPAPTAKPESKPVAAAPAPIPAPASPVIEASLAVDKSIGELTERIAQTEKKIDLALALPGDGPAIAAVTAHVEALRGDLERLMAEHEKVSEAVGQVSANVSALSQSAAQIGPMSDTLGHLNEAILSLRQDLPQIAEQTAERTQGQVLTALAQKGENPELAEKLAIVQNLLLSRAVEQRESDTRSHGALESIRDLVQNLHHRIDAMEAAEEPVLHDVPAAATAAAAPVLVAAPMATQGPRVVHSAPEVESTEAPTVSAQAMSREDLIASARRAAMAAAQPKAAGPKPAPAPAAAQPEPTRSPTADLRTFVPVAPAKPAGLAGLLRSPVGMVAMVVLLAISLGMIYAKVMRKPAQPGAPKVVIEQTTVPAMPAELPEAVTPAAVAKPAAAVPLIVPPNDKPAQKSSGLLPDEAPVANASTLADAGGAQNLAQVADAIVETASTMGSSDTLPAGIAPLSQRTAALAGDPAAAYIIADRYLKGNATVDRDPAKAAHWFEQSAKAGSALAEFKLGVMNEKGDGVSVDTARAMDWYRAGANHGNVQAMHNLAVLHTSQSGAPDYESAAKWFESAANFGLKDSQYNLAVLHANGLGVPKDAGKAYKWFSIAAARGDADAAKQRDALRKSLMPTKATEVEAEIRAWHAKPQDRKANMAEAMGLGMGEAVPAIGNKAANDIGAVQKMLSQLGYDPGTLDGTLTGQTREAIRTFQKRSGLKATGEIDEALTAKLKGLAG